MTNFLTVKEAARLIGKSPSSIRRIIYPILDNDQHPDRQHIEPDVETAKALRMKGENFAWKISEEMLRRAVPEGEAKSACEPKSTSELSDQSPAIIDMLSRELDIKNHQIGQQSELISKQMELINGLSERLREGNILIGSLQQHLALTDGRTRPPSEAVAVAKTNPVEKGSKTGGKSAKPTRGFFRRLFP
jgi:hypothetical protein